MERFSTLSSVVQLMSDRAKNGIMGIGNSFFN